MHARIVLLLLASIGSWSNDALALPLDSGQNRTTRASGGTARAAR